MYRKTKFFICSYSTQFFPVPPALQPSLSNLLWQPSLHTLRLYSMYIVVYFKLQDCNPSWTSSPYETVSDPLDGIFLFPGGNY